MAKNKTVFCPQETSLNPFLFSINSDIQNRVGALSITVSDSSALLFQFWIKSFCKSVFTSCSSEMQSH